MFALVSGWERKGTIKERDELFCGNFSARQLNYYDASGPSGFDRAI